MQIAFYLAYALVLLVFIVLASFAVFHAFKYRHISPRTVPITWVFVFVSVVLAAVSLYFVFSLEF